MTDNDAEVLRAAITIRQELPTLVPADAETLGVELNEHITKAEAVSGEERSTVIDEIYDLLTRREPTRERLRELAPVIDIDRGVAEGVWAPDQILAGDAGDRLPPGAPGDDKGVIEITCQTCSYLNKLAFRPPADDLPYCQNPTPPQHLLRMA